MVDEPLRIDIPEKLFQAHQVSTHEREESLVLPYARIVKSVAIKKDSGGTFYLELEE